MSATWTCPYCNRSVLGSNCYCMASEEQKLHGRIEELEAQLALLRSTFEELKKIRDSLDAECVSSRIQELIWKIGKQLGEF